MSGSRSGPWRTALAAAYIVPSFVVAFAWHLQIFASRYEALRIYRDDILVPFGLLAMLVQAIAFVLVLERWPRRRGVLADGLRFAAWGGFLSWTYTTLAVAAKYPMASIGEYLALETGFTVVQWLLVGPTMVWVSAVSSTAPAPLSAT